MVPKRHGKYEGIMVATVGRYRRQIIICRVYLRCNKLNLPGGLEDLDIMVDEYINSIYQDDYPINSATT